MMKQKSQGFESQTLAIFFGDPLGVRTQDPHIKSVMLYRLS